MTCERLAKRYSLQASLDQPVPLRDLLSSCPYFFVKFARLVRTSLRASPNSSVPLRDPSLIPAVHLCVPLSSCPYLFASHSLSASISLQDFLVLTLPLCGSLSSCSYFFSSLSQSVSTSLVVSLHASFKSQLPIPISRSRFHSPFVSTSSRSSLDPAVHLCVPLSFHSGLSVSLSQPILSSLLNLCRH